LVLAIEFDAAFAEAGGASLATLGTAPVSNAPIHTAAAAIPNFILGSFLLCIFGQDWP